MMLVERVIIAKLIQEMDTAGFVPVKFWDGGEYQDIPHALPTAALENSLASINSVDEGTLHFAPKTGPQEWGKLGVLLILGNGEDIISDYHCGNAQFDAAVERVYEYINGTETIRDAAPKVWSAQS